MTTHIDMPVAETASVPTRPNAAPAGRIIWAFAGLTGVAAIVGVIVSGASYEASPDGLPDAGPVVGWGIPITTALVFVTAMCTVGLLLHAAFLDPGAKQGLVSPAGRRSLTRTAVTACVWFFAALAAASFNLAQILGVPLSTALRPATIATYGWDITSVRTLVITAVLAGIVGIGSLLTARLSTATLWLVLALVAIAMPALAGHAAGLGNHALATVNGVAHVVSATVWIGGVIALGIVAWSRSPAIAVAAHRFSPLAAACVVVLVVSGVFNAYARLGSFGDLLTSGYGQLVLIKSLLLIGLLALGLLIRQRILPTLASTGTRRAFAKVASLELGLMAVATGFGVALSASQPTRPSLELPSAGESLLGFTYPAAPDLTNVLLGWYFDPLFFFLGIAGAGFYLAGVLRLRARGDHWPISRTIYWLLGVGIVIWATNSGIARYSDVSVGIHMIQHMTLAMMAPIPLVLAAPITLALRAIHPSPNGGRGPRELLTSFMHSTLAKVITNPLYVLFVYAFGIYGLYFSGLFGALMANHLGHIAMTAHFLLSGCLLAWVTMGVDPQPKPLPYWERMFLVMIAVVLHSFFAVALMSSATPIGESWYGQVRPPWLSNPVGDTVLGGQIAWGVGEIPTLLMLMIIAVQWFRSDTRESKRRDRFTQSHGDAELEDYNAYLAKLNELAKREEERR